MKIRNLPYNRLNDKERNIVIKHYNYCMHSKDMKCCKLHKDIDEFWKAHRETDTDEGKYDGWIE